MGFSTASLKLLVAWATLAHVAGAAIRSLTEQSFQHAVDEVGDLMVLFYSPDDDSSKKFRSTFETSSNELESHSPKVVFAKVDVTREKKLAAKYGVKYYPTLRYFKEGEKRAVSGDEAMGSQNELVTWIRRVSLAPPRIMELKTSKQMKAFKRNITRAHDVAVIGFFKDKDSASLFIDVATDFNYPVKFAWTTRSYARKIFNLGPAEGEAMSMEEGTGDSEGEEEKDEEMDEDEDEKEDEDVENEIPETDATDESDSEDENKDESSNDDASPHEVIETGELLMLKPYDEKNMTYTYGITRKEKGDSRHGVADLMNMMIGVPQEEALKMMPKSEKSENMTEWIQTMMIPLVVPFAQGYDSLIFQGPIKLHEILLVDSENAEDSELIRLESMFQEVAMDHRGEILHIIMGNNKNTDDIREYFGIDNEDLPTLIFSDLREATDDAPQGEHYIWDKTKEVNVENMRAFEADFWSGTLAEQKSKKTKSKSKKKKSKKPKSTTTDPVEAADSQGEL